jgi:hypothetical protein
MASMLGTTMGQTYLGQCSTQDRQYSLKGRQYKGHTYLYSHPGGGALTLGEQSLFKPWERELDMNRATSVLCKTYE